MWGSSGITSRARSIDGHLSMSSSVMQCAISQSLWGSQPSRLCTSGKRISIPSRAPPVGRTVNLGGYHLSEYGHHFIHLSCPSQDFGEILDLVNAFPFRQIDYCLYNAFAQDMWCASKVSKVYSETLGSHGCLIEFLVLVIWFKIYRVVYVPTASIIRDNEATSRF